MCTCNTSPATASLGYADSGREVFDEEYDSEEEEEVEERGEKEPNSKKRKKGKLGKSSIKDMLLRTKPKNEVCCTNCIALCVVCIVVYVLLFRKM